MPVTTEAWERRRLRASGPRGVRNHSGSVRRRRPRLRPEKSPSATQSQPRTNSAVSEGLEYKIKNKKMLAACAREIPICYPLSCSQPPTNSVVSQGLEYKKKIKKMLVAWSTVGRTEVQKKYRNVSCLLHVATEDVSARVERTGRAVRRTRRDAETG
jgi:hypothetical protein